MDYAIVAISGKQYVLEAGKEFLVEHLGGAIDESRTLSDVLVLRKGDDVQIGSPYISGVSVKAHVLQHEKGKKIRVSKFKAKVRYDKTIGFRPLYTRIRIDEIGYSHEKVKTTGDKSEMKPEKPEMKEEKKVEKKEAKKATKVAKEAPKKRVKKDTV